MAIAAVVVAAVAAVGARQEPQTCNREAAAAGLAQVAAVRH